MNKIRIISFLIHIPYVKGMLQGILGVKVGFECPRRSHDYFCKHCDSLIVLRHNRNWVTCRFVKVVQVSP